MNAAVSAMQTPPLAQRECIHAGGYDWHLVAHGHGPTCLLLHGTGASADSWRGLIPLLATHHRVIAIDLPGHARTRATQRQQLSLQHMADAVLELMATETTVFTTPPVGIGHSAGAAILAQMAVREPASLTRLISVNGALMPLRGLPRYTFSPLARVSAQSSWVTRLFVQRLQRPQALERLMQQTGSTLDEAGLAHYRHLCRDPRHIEGALNMMAAWRLDLLYPLLPRIRCPVHFIAGVRDRMIPSGDACQLQARIPGATLDIVEQLGHLAHEESPQRIATLIHKYINTPTQSVEDP